MKMITLLIFLASINSFAQDGSPNITITGGGVSITVRGTGGFVCSAQDSFKKQPRLGRGATMQEAQANANYLAAQTNNGDDFFVKIISCESSNSGAGEISISRDASGLRVYVAGPTQVHCVSNNSMKNPEFGYNAVAATQTEASALASNACTVGSNDNGFFCKTKCENIASTNSPSRRINGPRIKQPRHPNWFRF